MATTRLIPLHTGKGRNFGKAIRNVIGYVSNPKKTHQGELVTGFGCTVRAYCDDDIAVTYEDKLLELIRSGALQADASEKPKEPPAEHAA